MERVLTNQPMGVSELEQVVKTILFSHMQSIQSVNDWNGNLGQWYYDVVQSRFIINPLFMLLMGSNIDDVVLSLNFDALCNKVIEEDQQLFRDEMMAYVNGTSTVVEFVFRIRDQNSDLHHIYMSGKRVPDQWRLPYIMGDIYDVTQQYVSRKEQKMTSIVNPIDSTRDELTGLMTKDFFEDRVRKAITLARAGQEKFSLMAIDVDFFKNINAHFGEIKGDEVLVEIGRILLREVRATDVVGRIAGDRFHLLLTDIDVKVGQNVAERIRKSIANHMFVNGIRITISGGIKAYEGESRDQLNEEVSRLVKLSKKQGHNVMSYEIHH